MDFTDVIRDMNQVTVERAVEAVFARLKEEGWQPAQAPVEKPKTFTAAELAEARSLFVAAAKEQLQNPRRPKHESMADKKARAERLKLSNLTYWLHRRVESPPSNLVQLVRLVKGDPDDDDLRLLVHVLRVQGVAKLHREVCEQR